MKTSRFPQFVVVFMLSIAFILCLTSTAPAADQTVSIMQSDTVAQIQTKIQTAINAAGDRGAITVNGSKTGANETLELDIPTEITVIWRADYAGDAGVLIRLEGSGTFEVASGTISLSGDNGNAILFSDGKVTVSGGMVSSSGVGSSTICTWTWSSAVLVKDKGIVEATGVHGYSIYTLYGSATVTGGTVTASGERGIAISSSDGNIIVSGGTVSATGKEGQAIYTNRGTITVSGGKVESTDLAVYSDIGRESVAVGDSAADTDVSWGKASDWAISELTKAKENGLIPTILINGDLTKPTTRLEFAAISVMLYEELSGNTASLAPPDTFSDTSDPAVLKAYAHGIVNGIGGGLFAPNSELNREQAAVMLTNVYKAVYWEGFNRDTAATYTARSLDNKGVASFADDASISGWAKESVYFMSKNDIIKGVGDNSFAPKNNTTREQALIISERTLENADKIKDGGEVTAVVPDVAQQFPIRMETIAAGGASFAIKNDGNLWAWGNNECGRLGDGTNIDRYSPVKVLDNVVAVSASFSYTRAIKSDGSLWAWGYDVNGDGDKPVPNSQTPIKVMDDVVAVSTGMAHTLVIKSDGSLWAWGVNWGLDIRERIYSDRDTPVKVMDDVVAISAGSNQSMAIKKDGSLWAWGYNAYGNLGDGTTVDRPAPVKVMDDVAFVSAEACLAIKTDGSLWMWSSGNGLIYNDTVTNPYLPFKIMENVSAVSADSHTMIIKTDGSLWAWGWNVCGQIGDGTTTTRSTPVKIMDNVAAVSAGGHYSIALKTDGSLWSWGWDYLNEENHTPVKVTDGVKLSGLVKPTSTPLPTQTQTPISVDTSAPLSLAIKSETISAGNMFSAVIKKDGSLWCWGLNNSGQLGNGTNADSLIPIKIMDDMVSLSAGYEHSLALRKDGSLWAWGDNKYGQLGDGTTTQSLTPVKIMDGVATTSAGTNHSMAIKSDGSLWAWGENNRGQLGDGTDTASFTPVKIMNNVTDVSACGDSTRAIKADGSLWSWGAGILGDGGVNIRTIPIKVMDNVSAVSLSANSTMAIKKDNSLWAWGRDWNGHLGLSIGANRDFLTPTKVMDNVVSVSAGNNNTLVIKPDGSLLAFGQNASMAQMDNVIAVSQTSYQNSFSAFNSQSMVLKKDGSLWTLGGYDIRQLGDGTKIELIYNAPAKIMDDVMLPSTISK